jgi:hypothetical protein
MRRTSNLDQLEQVFSIPIPRDENGYVGRECPECKNYFKITPGTGLTGKDLSCKCPYCGYSSSPKQFTTSAQRRYAKSVVANRVTAALLKDLKSLEFNHRPRGVSGFGISLKVKGRPHSIRHYCEMELEEEVVCDSCTLRYTVFGTFAFCPDCGRHNSLQILEKNLALAQKQIDLAATVDGELSAQLIADALENGVSAFDGFGREACRIHASKATNPTKAEAVTFQNLVGTQKTVLSLFGFDLAGGLLADEWLSLTRCFQKRHLLAHSMGIVDAEYLRKTNDPQARVGRKIVIETEEVASMLNLTRKLGSYLSGMLNTLP